MSGFNVRDTKPRLRYFIDVVPANSSVIKNIPGNFLFNQTASGILKISLDDQVPISFLQNTKIRLPEDEIFSKIEIINETGGGLWLGYFLGFGDVDVSQTTLTGSVSTTGGQTGAYGAVSVGAAATLILSANALGTGWIIANNDPSKTVYLGTDAGVTTVNGLPLGPGGMISWDLRSALYGITASGTADIRTLLSTT